MTTEKEGRQLSAATVAGMISAGQPDNQMALNHSSTTFDDAHDLLGVAAVPCRPG